MSVTRMLRRGDFFSIREPNRNTIGNSEAFSTNLFLDRFSADPVKGYVFVPQVQMDHGVIRSTVPIQWPFHDSMVGADLPYDEEGDATLFMIRDRVSEAERILKEARGVWDSELPYRLPVTNGEWTMHPMRLRDQSMSVDRRAIRRSYNAGVVLRSRGGKHVAFWDNGDGRQATVGVGNSGKYAAAYQSARIDLSEELGDGYVDAFTERYFMRFVGLGMQALKRRVGGSYFAGGVAYSWMAYTALGVANKIYFLYGHSPKNVTKPPCISCDGRDYELIEKRDSLRFPSSFAPSNREFSIRLSGVKTPEDNRVVARITLGSDGLFIDIDRVGYHNNSSDLPLSPSVVALWEGAQILAKADPDDGGYLARIM